MKIRVTRGLDIPLKGMPSGAPQPLPQARCYSLNLSSFEHVRFKLLVANGESVKRGTPLVEVVGHPGLYFVAPAGGIVVDVRRGLKRRLLDIVIAVEGEEENTIYPPLDPQKTSQEALIARLMQGGAFPYIRSRPFDCLAVPTSLPRDIFVSAIESAPFEPPSELQVSGYEEDFQMGLDVLARLTTGRVHLVHRESSRLNEAKRVEHHTVTGPHPAGNSSIHIHHIAPIESNRETVWTLSAVGVIVVGQLVRQGTFHHQRIFSVAGEGMRSTGFFYGRVGYPLDLLSEWRVEPSLCILGNPLMGRRGESGDFLGLYDHVICAMKISTKRELFHFLRLGWNKFTMTRTYFSDHQVTTTNQHGEERAFIDGSIYDKVMPMRIPTMQLIKAILAEDDELAQDLGLLEVAPEDFALPTFVCPSKIEMVDIVKRGLHRCALDQGL